MDDDDTDPDVPRRGPGSVSNLRERQAPPVLD
jgi:histidinol-phosphatase